MVSIINILSILNLLGLGLLIGVRKYNTRTNRVLGLMIFIPATDFLINLLSYKGILVTMPYLVFVNFSFLWTPCILWYVYLVLKIKQQPWYKIVLHFVPQLIVWSYWIYVISQGETYARELFENRTKGVYSWQLETFVAAALLQSLGYLGYCSWLIIKIRPAINSDPLSVMRWNWIKQFIILLSALVGTAGLCCFIFPPVVVDNFVVPILYDVSALFLVYKCFGSSGIFTDFNYGPAPTVVAEKERYINSLLKPEQIAAYKNKLHVYLMEKEPYTDPELTLTELSALTGIQAHYLSQVINQEFGKNFFDLINSYRIEKSKSLMNDPQTANLTLEAIGLQSGFGSASSFYRSFKKQTGITPKAFLKTQNEPAPGFNSGH